MKKRGSNDFPFNDLAGPQKTPWNNSGEPAEINHSNAPVSKSAFTDSAKSIPVQPVQRPAGGTFPKKNQPSAADSYQQRPPPVQGSSYQREQSGQSFAYQRESPVQSSVNQQRPSPVPNPPYKQSTSYQSGGPYQPGGVRSDSNNNYQPGDMRSDSYKYYQQEPREQVRANAGYTDYNYERRPPRPKTLNRQIEILTLISAGLLIIVVILGYFTFFAGKKPSKDSSATTAATTAVTTAALSDPGAGVSVTPGSSDTAAATTQLITATSAAAVDNDPNSLANLPPSKEHPVIALTFDDGPSNKLTPQLLSVLEEKGVHVTFFMLGQMVLDADPAILKRMLADGDELGNHSYDHTIYTGLTADGIREQLTKTNDAIFAATGTYPTVMRPPTGGSNDTVLAISKEMNMPVVNWSYESCPEDWLKAHQTPEFISQYVIDNAANGHIVLLHDIHSATVESIAAMIDGLTAKGFRFATVSELLAAQPDGKQTGVLYCYGKFTK